MWDNITSKIILKRSLQRERLIEERFATYKNLGMGEEEIKTREEKLYAINE
jgi:hypothetical protein